MSINNKLATAALTGLLSAGLMVAGTVAHAADAQKSSSASYQVAEKHACKGQNSCKGLGADGKNACKGQGSCKTDS